MRSLINVVKKELRQTLRDQPMVRMLILAPVLQLLLFGYAINMDVDNIPTVVCDQDKTSDSRALVQSFLAGDTFSFVAETLTPNDADKAIERGDAAVALIVPRGYALRIARHDAPEAQVIVDGTDSTRAQVAANAAGQLLKMKGIGASPDSRQRGPISPSLVPRILYNPTLESSIYMIPGILGVMLIAITAIMMAMGIARERETGTLEQVLVTPIRPLTLLIGKCIPFILFGLIDIAAVLLIASYLFDLPMRGPLTLVGSASFLYLFSTLGVGIVLSTVSATQQQAMLGATAFMLPSVLLSGFLSPISTMPTWLQPITYLNPLRYFIDIVRTCLLKGGSFQDVRFQLFGLTLLGLCLLTFAVLRFRHRVA